MCKFNCLFINEVKVKGSIVLDYTLLRRVSIFLSSLLGILLTTLYIMQPSTTQPSVIKHLINTYLTVSENIMYITGPNIKLPNLSEADI